jgi:hypothetical protein
MSVAKGGLFCSDNCYTTLEISYSIHTFQAAFMLSRLWKKQLPFRPGAGGSNMERNSVEKKVPENQYK